ncbi:hypothetical protein MJO28_002952 [Puccinia striiformis f. sp. tritici]|uniref:Uncharacterized protein n=1 Tax=Puccinia striiformis f. sp. tritici TaxID=168172 RepID=A0ACC0ETE4_9BASI|nr:hypothetical protein MJO28_002952 [Puccinia striiformis f. sp. tritici]
MAAITTTPNKLRLIENHKELAKWIELVPNPSGTRQKITALKDHSIHLAMALTESLIAGIILGKGDYKLIGAYVTSPLNWAVITGTNTKYKAITDLKGQKMGISRPGFLHTNSKDDDWISSHGVGYGFTTKKTLEETIKKKTNADNEFVFFFGFLSLWNIDRDLGLAGVIPDSNQMMIPNQLVNTEVAKVTNT